MLLVITGQTRITPLFWSAASDVYKGKGNDSASWSNGSAGGNSSALKGATGVRMATEVPGNVSASWRSLFFLLALATVVPWS